MRDQGDSRAMLSLKAPGKDPSVPLPASGGGRPSLVSLRPLPLVSCDLLLLSRGIPSSYEDTSHWIRTHHDDLILTTSAKALFS